MTNVLEYLEAKASEDASKTAVCDDRREYTRGCLLSRSRSIGSALLKVVSKRQPVIVFMEKTADTLAAFFGVVYAGACYCMADPQLPTVRLRQIHGSLNTQVILTDDAHMDRAKEVFGGCSIFDADAFAEHDIDEEGLLSVRMRHLDTDPLYVNFTSGSTGTPKGVAICHRSVIDFIDTFTGQFGIREDDVIGNQAPFDFDVSVKDIYSSMKTGARLAVIPRPLFTTPAPLLDFMCGKGVTVMIWAVSALCLVSAFHGLDYKTPEDVRLVMFSGEVMPLKRLKDWTDHLPDAVFVNLYGPTEITCNCTFHVIDRERDYIEGIPIGRSFPNEETFLLDENDNEITPDQRDRTGEICVRGTAVGLGYWNNRQQTQERFREDPRTPEYASIIYCTGDLGRYNDRGELVFCGRRDDQVKYRGHRIELAEIELAMNSISGVDRSCCIFEDRKDQLHGFYCGSIEKGGLAQALKDKIPVYMIPGRLHKLDSLPVTGRGKIDRKALMEGLSGRKRVQPEK